MKYTLEEKFLSLDFLTLVENIKQSEQTRDFEVAISAFKPIWKNIETDPDFSNFPLEQQAQLYRLAGYLVSNYGHQKTLRNYQERGKNLLSKAIFIFEDLKKPLLVAEAQNALAMCYILEGSFLEAESILEQTASDFLSDRLNLIYLQNRGNLLITKFRLKKYFEALEIIKEIEIPMEFCNDLRSCFVFHEKVGLIYRASNQFDLAISHYHKAIAIAKRLNSLIFISSIKNNLAFLFIKIRNFELAHSNINEAIQIAQELQQPSWLASYLDTKALIYAKQGYYSPALEFIDQAISILISGEDANAYTEALWNKCKFLLALERKEEAITLFGQELIPIATQQMGEFAVKNFVKEFSELVHIKNNGTFEQEIRRFKRVEIVNALRETNYNLYDAADFLKIEPNLLVQMIDDEFPELYQEFGILRISDLLNQNANQIQTPPNISEICLDSGKIICEQTGFQNFKTFYFSQIQMQTAFNISQEAVVAFLNTSKIPFNEFVLVQEISTNSFYFGKINYDNDLRLYFLESQNETFPISLDDFQVIGEPLGYFPFEEINQETLNLRTF